ncbi:hypothetical protein KF707_02160 [Candidatus Obscuribacterales bacterium]|nr:hypothetical protein [Candidatus Obscuribacterales bacterium]MBX3135009.1 hypothetical protein [Candidatus Obscuribacterales bacterium]MBX3151734.1 hypothetical protein [Candidatus Obscuribacterales bacterium]
MALTDHRIKTNKRGEHVVAFTTDKNEFIAPSTYEERLAWIRSSFDSFYNVVKEKEAVREFCNKA